MKLTTEHIGDARIDIDVDSSGHFSATFNDQEYQAATRLELLEKLRHAVKKAARQGSVEVTVLGLIANPKHGKAGSWTREDPYMKGAGVVDAKLRAKHERQHGVFLLVAESGQKFQVGSYGSDPTIARRLTQAEAAQYIALVEAVRVATTALEDFEGNVSINASEELEKNRGRVAS